MMLWARTHIASQTYEHTNTNGHVEFDEILRIQAQVKNNAVI